MDPDSFTDSFDTSSSSSDSQCWIDRFCSMEGNEYFCQVDEDFLMDKFNFTQLNKIPDFHKAFSIHRLFLGLYLRTDVFFLLFPLPELINDIPPTKMSAQDYKILEIKAQEIYCFIHERYINSLDGLEEMKRKYLQGDFGYCPRYECNNQRMLPVGVDDHQGEIQLPQNPNKPGPRIYGRFKKYKIALFCPKCRGIYRPSDQKHRRVDGTAFGPTFPMLFLATFPQLCVESTNAANSSFQPRIYGFRISENSPIWKPQSLRNSPLSQLNKAGKNIVSMINERLGSRERQTAKDILPTNAPQ